MMHVITEVGQAWHGAKRKAQGNPYPQRGQVAGGDVDVSTAAAHASCICRGRLQFVMTAELSKRLHAPNTQRGGDMAHTLAHYWIVHGCEGHTGAEM